MGCCNSHPTDDSEHHNSPYSPSSTHIHHGDSSSRAITSSAIPPSTSQQPQSLTQTTSHSHSHLSSSRPSQSNSHSGSRPSHLPLSEHYNLPVHPHIWRCANRTWTPGQLSRERREFFDTRVTGRAEVWAALSTATELLRAGDTATAQGIIDAAGVTVPTGDLCDGCYDERGTLYRFTEPVVADPTNIGRESGEEPIRSAGLDEPADVVAEGKMEDSDEEEEEEEAEEVLERRREEKGKGSERDAVKVKARLSDRGGPDVVVLLGKSQNVGALARRVAAEAGIQGKARIKIAYLGRILKENEPLLTQGWKEGHVVNALVATTPSPS